MTAKEALELYKSRDASEKLFKGDKYLRKNTEDIGNTWSSQMIKLLCEMNQVRKEAIKETGFETAVVAGYEEKCDDLIALGRLENVKTQHRYAKDEKRNY